MRLVHYVNTDSLDIHLSERPSVESQEIAEGFVLDYDDNGNIVGIDIDNASAKVNLEEVVFTNFPSGTKRPNA